MKQILAGGFIGLLIGIILWFGISFFCPIYDIQLYPVQQNIVERFACIANNIFNIYIYTLLPVIIGLFVGFLCWKISKRNNDLPRNT